MISKNDVEKLAQLARIEISHDENERLQKDLEAILGYVSELSEVAGEGGTAEKDELVNVFRDDSLPHESGQYTEAILENAPRAEGGYFAVKTILER